MTELDDGWELRGFLGDDWQLHRADRHRGGSGWIPARVPGSVLADLVRAGEAVDPYHGTDSRLAEWVPQRTWVYRRTLSASLAPHERAFLEFDGIDYSATVLLDGSPIARHEGTYVPLVVEVSAQLRDGAEHLLAVVIDPAPVSEPQVGHTDKVTVHKGRMGYGWDFCPRIVHQGIWRTARLRITGPARLVDVWARPRGDRVEVEVQVDESADIRCTLTDGSGTVVAEGPGPLDVAQPRRWRPGEPYVYRLQVEARTADRVSDSRTVPVGFRDIRFAATASGALAYQLVVDGTPTYVKGWNWVPVDALYAAADAARLRHLLQLARDAGVNVLRVWGGGLIESPEFYDLCDELGVLVWQEFAQSSSGIRSVPSADPEFVRRMHSEAEQIVPALRNHPSLAIWCGGNELAHEDGRPLDHAPVLDALAGVVRRLDPDRHWLPTSPSGPTFSSTAAGEQHDVHGPWEHQGLDDHYRLYNEGRSLLLSEFGVEGMSNVRAIESVVPTDWQTLPTKGAPVWEHLGRWWNNEPLVQDAFGGRLTDIATLSRASQFLQADGLRYAVEANRRRAISCGVLPWQFNEPFPNGWCTSAVDYFGEPKAAYHYVRRAYRERHVSAELAAPRVDELHATVWAWSERTPLTTTVRARVLRLDGTVIRSASWEVSLSAGQPARAGVIDCSAAELDGRPFLLDLELGLDRTSNRYLLTAGEDFGALLDLPPAELDVQFDAETLRLRNDGPSVVPLLRVLDARAAADPGWITWDDNAIDLLPGEQRVLRGRWTGTAERRIAIDSWNGRYAIDG